MLALVKANRRRGLFDMTWRLSIWSEREIRLKVEEDVWSLIHAENGLRLLWDLVLSTSCSLSLSQPSLPL